MKAIPMDEIMEDSAKACYMMSRGITGYFEERAIDCNPADPPGHGRHGDLDKLLKRLDSWQAREPSSTPYAQGYRDALTDLAANIRDAITAQTGAKK